MSQSRAAGPLLLVNVAAGSILGAMVAVLVLSWAGDVDFGRIGPLTLVLAALNVAVVRLLQRDRGTASPATRTPHSWTPAPASPRPPVDLAKTPGERGPDQFWYVRAAVDAEELRNAPRQDIQGVAVSQPAQLPKWEFDYPPGRVEEHPVPGRTGTTRRIVQCPECGAFDVDVWNEPTGFAFTCRRCRGIWQWAPGRPWPATIVQPARGRTRPAKGSS
jgi:hypothetical protein